MRTTFPDPVPTRAELTGPLESFANRTRARLVAVYSV